MAFEPMVVQPSPESSAKIFSSAPKETLHPLSSHSLSAPLPQPLVTTSLLSVWDEPPNIMVSERSQTKKAIYKIPEIDEINRNRMQIGGFQGPAGREREKLLSR